MAISTGRPRRRRQGRGRNGIQGHARRNVDHSLYYFTNRTDDSVPVYTVFQGQDGNFYGVSEAQYGGQYGAFFKIRPKAKLRRYPTSTTPTAPSPTFRRRAPTAIFMEPRRGAEIPTCKCGVVYKATAGGKITVLHNFTGYPTTTDAGPSACWCRAPTEISTEPPTRGRRQQRTELSSRSPPPESTRCSTASTRRLAHLYDAQLPDGGSDPRNRRQLLRGSERTAERTNYGAIFEITPAGAETVLYSFCSVTCTDGFVPTTPLVLHTNGKFYGNTNGNSLGGSVFYSFDVGFKPLVDLVTWTAKVGEDGRDPRSGLHWYDRSLVQRRQRRSSTMSPILT